MKRTVFIVLGFVGMVSLSLSFTTDDPPYKNLKILPQNITKEQMDSVMHHFTGSLNVKCNFCHVRDESKKEWDYASDANKHKLVAREMMEMTNALNDKYFDFTGGQRTITTQLMVTCYTCHHGETQPAVKLQVRLDRPPLRSVTPDTTRRSQ